MICGCTDGYWQAVGFMYINAVLGTDKYVMLREEDETGDDRIGWAEYLLLTELVWIEGSRRARLNGESDFYIGKYYFTVADEQHDLFPYWCALHTLSGLDDFPDANNRKWQDDPRSLADEILSQAPPHWLYYCFTRFLSNSLISVVEPAIPVTDTPSRSESEVHKGTEGIFVGHRKS